MARIAWIEDSDATGETADLYRELRQTSASGRVPDILRTKMIASYVSALNRCHC